MKREKAVYVAREFLIENARSPWKYGVVFYSLACNVPLLIAHFNDIKTAQVSAWATQSNQIKKGNYYYFSIFYKEENNFPTK